MTSMYEKIVAVISKPPEERTTQTIQALLPWFKKKSDVFASLKQDIVIDIIRNCSFVTRPRDYVIIKQGDVGDCFYIILRGSVSIHINNLISDEEDEAKLAEHSRVDKVFLNEKGQLDRAKYGNFIVQFVDGKSFGELALINKNCIRNASIISDETTDLLVVNRELYNRSLRAAQAAEFEQRTNFVKYHPFFGAWAPKHKKQLAMSLEKIRVPFEGHICRQGDPVRRLYFLLSGQAKILVDGAQHQTQYPQFYPLQDPNEILAREELEQGSVQHLPPKKKELVLNYNDKPLALAPYAQRVRERVRKLTELSIVGEKEIIGDTEIVLELKTVLQTVECTELCEAYVLEIKNYERLVSKRNNKTVDLIRQHAQVKLYGRINRLAEDQAPLLKTLLFKMERMDRNYGMRARRRERASPVWSDVVPQRGALIDMYGPGTVFYRSRMRDEAMKKKKSKQGFRGAKFGLSVPVSQQVTTSQSNDIDDVINYVDHDGGGTNVYDTESDDDYDYERKHVTVVDQSVHPYGSPFLDYKSSDRALTVLEERIKHWHSTITTNKHRKQHKPGTTKLERVKIHRSKELVPGRTVILRKKRPRVMSMEFLGPSRTSTNSHSTSDHMTSSSSRDRTNESSGSTGIPKTPVYSGRIPRAEEEHVSQGEVDDLSGSLLTPRKFLRLYLTRSSPSESDYDLDRPPPPESKGTILDILKTREVIEGKTVAGIHTRGEQAKLNTLRPMYMYRSTPGRKLTESLPQIGTLHEGRTIERDVQTKSQNSGFLPSIHTESSSQALELPGLMAAGGQSSNICDCD